MTAGASPTSPISAVFMAPVGVLSVMGTAQNDIIVVSRDAAGKLLVNGGAVPIQGPTATVANTSSLIEVFGLDGDDNLALDEANGALPRALLFGVAGNDTLTGGSGDDQLFGQAGNDGIVWNPGDGSWVIQGQRCPHASKHSSDDASVPTHEPITLAVRECLAAE